MSKYLHIVLSGIVARRSGPLEHHRLRADFDGRPLLLILAGFLDGKDRIALWVIALAIEYLGPTVIGMGRGWRIAPEHFAERHGLIIIIAR